MHNWRLTSVPDWPQPKDWGKTDKNQLGWKCDRCGSWAAPKYGFSNAPADDLPVSTYDGIRDYHDLTCEESIVHRIHDL